MDFSYRNIITFKFFKFIFYCEYMQPNIRNLKKKIDLYIWILISIYFFPFMWLLYKLLLSF